MFDFRGLLDCGWLLGFIVVVADGLFVWFVGVLLWWALLFWLNWFIGWFLRCFVAFVRLGWFACLFCFALTFWCWFWWLFLPLCSLMVYWWVLMRLLGYVFMFCLCSFELLFLACMVCVFVNDLMFDYLYVMWLLLLCFDV